MSVIYPVVVTAAITLGAFVPVWAILNSLAKRRDRRPEVLPPGTERVLILGASSGVGRALAHGYAERGAKVCVVARRSAELEVVRSECEALAAPVSSAKSDRILTLCADITRAEDLVTVRNTINECEFLIMNLIFILSLTPFTGWHGLDTLIVAAGVSALRPVLEIAGVEGPSVTQPNVKGVRQVEDAAMAAIRGNYLGPLLSVVTMVCR